jgi:diguanylate cyclase (GGDEF)-like protein
MGSFNVLYRKFQNFISITKQVMRGEILMENTVRFRVMSFMTAGVHLIFCICMMIMDVSFLMYYNVAVVCLYLIMGTILVDREEFLKIYLLIYLEIEIHAAVASICLGWNWNFMLYTVALIPAAFYFANALAKEKGHFAYALISSGFVAICYLAVSVITRYVSPVIWVTGHVAVKTFLMYFNVFIAFLLQFVFSYLFVQETKFLATVLEKENRDLGHDASFDPLTKLMNRRSMSKLMEEEAKRCDNTDERFWIIMTDIDDFKRVNDTYGHDIGDVVLQKVAEIVMDVVREGDLTCRWGGEEFLLLIHGNRNDGQIVAERIRQRVAEEIYTTASKKQFSITITLGVSEFQSGRQLRTLIEAADQKLYYGKGNGKNQVVV